MRDFAKATGKRAKTDALDAAVLAHFAEAIQPSVSTIADEDSQRMAELVARRRQIVEMLTAEKNRLGTVRGSVRQDIEAHLEWLEKRLEELEAQLQQAIRAKSVVARAGQSAEKRAVTGRSHIEYAPSEPARVGESEPQAN